MGRRRTKAGDLGCLGILALAVFGLVATFMGTDARSPPPSTAAPVIITRDPASLPPPPAPPPPRRHRHHHGSTPTARADAGYVYPSISHRTRRDHAPTTRGVWVNGYCRRDGRCVRGYWRSR